MREEIRVFEKENDKDLIRVSAPRRSLSHSAYYHAKIHF